MGGCEGIRNVDRLPAHRRQHRVHGAARRVAARARRASSRTPASPSGSAPSIRCSSSTRRARPASPRACSTAPAATCCWAMLTMRWTFDIKPTDVFWCTADIGWVTGHTYIAYGPLAVGATEVVFEGVPTYPDAGRFWQTIAEAQGHRSSTRRPRRSARSIKASGVTPSTAPKNYDLSTPAPPRHRRRADQSGSVDVVPRERRRRALPDRRHVVADRDRRPHDHAAAGRHADWCRARARCRCRASWPAIVDETGHDVANGHGGILVIKRPWPAMIRTIWGDPERYKKSLLPGGARRQALPRRRRRGARQDDAATSRSWAASTTCSTSRATAWARWRSSRRWSRTRCVAEAAVVGRPDDLTGEAVCAFVVLKQARPTGDEARRSRRSCATGSARRSARSRSPRTSASATTCRRRARARSCGGCCARSPRARRSRRTFRRSRIRRYWTS